MASASPSSPPKPNPVSSKAKVAEKLSRADKIKECFRKFDTDDNGFISKNELRQLLGMLGAKAALLTDEDVEQCLHEADTNGNGAIEYNEFIDWLMRPGSSIGATSDGRVERFDLEKALHPLFRVYDRNGDGTITREEYMECHTILRNALSLCPPGKEDPQQDPELLANEAAEVFKDMDGDHNQAVGFPEFVEFQRTALKHSGLSNADLEELLPALSRQLARIFKVVDSEETGELDEGEEALLRKMIDNVAAFSRDLWNTHGANKNRIRDRVHYANRWVEPPIGLNINDLKKKHLLLRPIRVFGVESVYVDILCIPALPKDAENKSALPTRREVQVWLANVIVKVTYKTGQTTEDGPHYYKYKDLSWEPAQYTGEKFTESINAFSPELRVYAMLRCEANFSLDLSWKQLNDGMQRAIEAGYVTELQFQEYKKHMDLLIAQSVYEDTIEGCVSPNSVKRERHDRLERLVIPAHSVMLVMAELKIFEVSSQWADFIHASKG